LLWASPGEACSMYMYSAAAEQALCAGMPHAAV